MSFHQGCDVTVAGAGEQITFPMTGNRAVFNLCRPLANGDGINDLPLGLPAAPGVHGAADQPLGSQVLNQLFFNTPRAWMNKLR